MADVLDIFCKGRVERKLSERVGIVVDKMERESVVAGELVNMGCAVEFKKLDVGDYIAGGVVVERKSANDFFSSMIDKRLMRQIEELRQFERHLLIVEGIDKEFYERFENSNSIRGFLLSLALNEKVPIVFTLDEKETAVFLYLLAKPRNKSEASLRASRKILNDRERTQFILEGFAGIGPKSAKKLLDKFGSLKNIFNAKQDELMEILGKRTDEFIRVLGG